MRARSIAPAGTGVAPAVGESTTARVGDGAAMVPVTACAARMDVTFANSLPRVGIKKLIGCGASWNAKFGVLDAQSIRDYSRFRRRLQLRDQDFRTLNSGLYTQHSSRPAGRRLDH